MTWYFQKHHNLKKPFWSMDVIKGCEVLKVSEKRPFLDDEKHITKTTILPKLKRKKK